jgi:AraC-like DNA-binding protein
LGLASQLNARVKDNVLILPEDTGEGFLSSIEFEDADALIYNYSIKQQLSIKREKDQKEFYTLVFDEIEDNGKFGLEIGQNILSEDRLRNSAIYLTSFLYDTEYILYEGLRIKGLRINLSREWMKKYLKLTDIEDVLETYVSMKTGNLWYKPVDAESKALFYEIIQNPKDKNLLFYQNKILRIAEIFFEWLRSESKNLDQKPVSRTDIERAQKIEDILTSEDVVLPPTIKELSRVAAMSESKLKKVFKTVFGLPIYEYFQRHRMQKAKIMLMSGNYSIKDVGYSLGYANLSNFTLAFKKEFGKLPSNLVKDFR